MHLTKKGTCQRQFSLFLALHTKSFFDPLMDICPRDHNDPMKSIFPLHKIALSICLQIMLVGFVSAQFSIGTWRDHLPYNELIDVCVIEEVVYAASPYSLFRYDNTNAEITRYSKTNYLSDVGITCIEYDPTSKYVVVGYNNGNIDLVNETGGINIPDIQLSNIVGDKKIYDIYPFGDRIYLSAGFGIVVIDTPRKEVKETYFIGENGAPVTVTDVVIAENLIYAATADGLLSASINNPFLPNYTNWTPITSLPNDTTVKHLEYFNGYLLMAQGQIDRDVLYRSAVGSGIWETFIDFENIRFNEVWSDDEWFTVSCNLTYFVYHFDFLQNYNMAVHNGYDVHANNSVVGTYGIVWTADRQNGLLYKSGNTEKNIRPQGPISGNVRRIEAFDNNIWIAHGGTTPDWTNQWRLTGLSGFVDETWRHIDAGPATITGQNESTTPAAVFDIMDLAVNPLNQNQLAVASWEEGVIMVNIAAGTGVVTNGDPEDGGIIPGTAQQNFAPGWKGVAGIAYDATGVLWCTNSFTDQGLHAIDLNGTYHSYELSPAVTASDKLGDILIDYNGFVYLPVYNKGLLVFNNNGTLGSNSDDNFKLLTDDEGNGGLPSSDVQCMEVDLDGEVWVGTAQGLGIFYNSAGIFGEEVFDAEPILIQQDGNTQELLSTESITCIKIDGSNRKWIGTQNSGVYLFSDDGLQQIYHFTEDNSPLFSNTIYDIAINHSNGEVLFATEQGVIGFFSTATKFYEDVENARVFPNPVRPEYTGNITIDGLAYNTNVKITDIQGNIVYETISEGGRAVWDGKRIDGARPASGVYLVFITNPDGSTDTTRKITFIR
jgi:hypothetical protein